ncbi:PPOX class F420-dependent oxidoreductase [Microbacterium sp. P01]|uniref:PPOX class F420-dependent oxidoreductase n=1 Tax=unclassified Microbacterium TaxID=2609290 RepID=UPI00366F63E6
MDLPPRALELLRAPSPCFLSTVMPDGSPQVTEVWVDTDGTHVIINTVQGHQKERNIRRDPRVAVAVADREDPTSYVQLRGSVIEATTEGGVESIEAMSQKYLGKPYSWYGGRDQVRVILKIAVARVSGIR